MTPIYPMKPNYKVGDEIDRYDMCDTCPFCGSEKEMETEDTDMFGSQWTKMCPDCDFEISFESKTYVTDIQVHHAPKFDEDNFTTDQVICADCEKPAVRWIEDKSSRVGNHCGCWADCEACGTITGVKSCPCDEE